MACAEYVRYIDMEIDISEMFSLFASLSRLKLDTELGQSLIL